MPAIPLETRIKAEARRLGFSLVGIAPAAEADGFHHLQEWLNRGYAGEMSYMRRHEEARRHPRSILETVRSVIMVGLEYACADSSPGAGVGGRVARYAQGPDYHDVLWEKLDELLDWLQSAAPGCRGRSTVDSAPLLERDFARRAGLGWFGKNTMLINKQRGSYFFIGALLVDLELLADAPHSASHCGTCTACLDACPTQAFTGPGWLDARRCISYLTIELRSPIPEDLRPGLGDWVFGCDICQDVCPWNRRAGHPSTPFAHRPELESLDPVELLGLSEEEFRRRFRGTALMRTKRRGLVRNAAIVLGNRGDPGTIPALERARTDPEPVVREAAQWAIERIRERNPACIAISKQEPDQ
jgi:epoxyqueuosine reductase